MSIPAVLDILKRIESIHQKKNEDYSAISDAFSNFTQASVISSWFKDETAKVFATMIGIKISRIANLMNKGTAPNNESLDDSFLDLDTYCILFHAWFSSTRDARESHTMLGEAVKNSSPIYPAGNIMLRCLNCQQDYNPTLGHSCWAKKDSKIPGKSK